MTFALLRPMASGLLNQKTRSSSKTIDGAVLTRADLTGSVLIDVQGCDVTGRLPGCTTAGS